MSPSPPSKFSFGHYINIPLQKFGWPYLGKDQQPQEQLYNIPITTRHCSDRSIGAVIGGSGYRSVGHIFGFKSHYIQVEYFRPDRPSVTNANATYPIGIFDYWAIQTGLLTPLTLARHRLSPLAAFTSGAYFLHTGRR